MNIKRHVSFFKDALNLTFNIAKTRDFGLHQVRKTIFNDPTLLLKKLCPFSSTMVLVIFSTYIDTHVLQWQC